MIISSERDGKEFCLPTRNAFRAYCRKEEKVRVRESQHRLPKVVIIYQDQYFRLDVHILSVN
jgi:hypothetical protein